jgi:hypothetical protein
MIDETYNNLLIENNQLKERICILEKKEITTVQFYTDIINKNVEINNLKELNDELNFKIIKLEQENLELKVKIIKLEKDNTQLKQDNIQFKIQINELKEENKEIKQENILQTIQINELKEENKELKNKITNLENKEIINKIIYSIQDLNSFDKLETILNFPFNKYINKLRMSRNDFCHYIFENDSNDLINKKKECILFQLSNLSDIVKIKLNKKFGNNFIDEIIKYLSNLQISYGYLSDEDINDAEEWWE